MHFTGQADTRKMLFRYSRLCGTASDAVDAVKLETISLGNSMNASKVCRGAVHFPFLFEILHEKSG